MKKIDPTVIKTTVYIAVFVIILSALEQSVFLIIGKWNISVLLGNLLGAAAAVANFFLMGLTVQASVDKDKEDAAKMVKFSQSGRLFMLFAVALIAYLVPVFNIVAAIIPYIFPRIAIALSGVFMKD